MKHTPRDTDDNAEPEAQMVQGDDAYAEQFHKHGMMRQPFRDRLAGLSRSFVNDNARNDQVGVEEVGVQEVGVQEVDVQKVDVQKVDVQKVGVQPTPQQGQQSSVPGMQAAKPGVAALRSSSRGPWLANHAGGRDVAQTPSNLG